MDKPRGPTSHDVVQRVRRAYRTRAVGHTGTLDPFATGLLVLLVGRATRLARFIELAPKTYLATARLGVRTDTDDLTGAPVGPPADPSGVTEPAVREALAALAGPQLQRPPAYSAKRVEGRRSYRLARAGRAVMLPEVAVMVHRIELVDWSPPAGVTFRAAVSAGTYLRALARDLGEILAVGAHLTALRREAVGTLRVEAALPLDAVGPDTPLLGLREVLADLPAVELDPAAREAVRHGRAVPGAAEPGEAVVLAAGREVVAVARGEGGWLRPTVVLEGA
ncbi:MAG TPA: tRNA pseudouridine(55) synthase TruB [Gemmatimonadales bacterium]|nr:tRNA pseudouridine(55) synthase TruB [Gemmatimonadales bacterium]